MCVTVLPYDICKEGWLSWIEETFGVLDSLGDQKVIINFLEICDMKRSNDFIEERHVTIPVPVS